MYNEIMIKMNWFQKALRWFGLQQDPEGCVECSDLSELSPQMPSSVFVDSFNPDEIELSDDAKKLLGKFGNPSIFYWLIMLEPNDMPEAAELVGWDLAQWGNYWEQENSRSLYMTVYGRDYLERL